MAHRLRRLVCRIVGHGWDEYSRPAPAPQFYTLVLRCTRCGAYPDA